MKKVITVLLGLSVLFARGGDVRFASIFSDNMVLQQKATVNLWGFAPANEALILKCSWLSSEVPVKTRADGKWSAGVNTPPANSTAQSISLISASGQTITLSNVLIGEVWLCSGQSNMEMILMSQPAWNMIVDGSEEEIANSYNPNIRFVNIQRKESFTPLSEVLSYGWKICTPNDVKWLSAVAYFFGKKLAATLHMPVGLIVSSYGGSPIQSWIPQEIIDRESLYNKERNDLDAELKASQQTEIGYKKAMADWISSAEAKGKKNRDVQAINLPVNFEKSSVGNQIGESVLSKEIIVPRSKGDLKISLGTMDDLGRVYFNGELVWEEIRNSKSYSQIQFTVPEEKIRTGKNVIEVHVLNILWGGGLTGPAENMYFTLGDNPQKTSLSGEWQFRKVFDLADAPPVPREGKPLFSTASALYNGMIYPLTSYTIKGCLWYQGESNVGDEERYPFMMTDLITSWRQAFGQEFPFYYVQIAPYKYDGDQRSKAAAFREAQAKVERLVTKTGMVVTMDLGNPQNIHPSKKREVGARLANMALSKIYKRDIPYKFPVLKKPISKGNAIELVFSNVYRGLKDRNYCNEFELSADGKTFYPAKIRLSESTIKVSCAEVQYPRFVRYCWEDASEGTIFNSEDLPLSSFWAEVPK